MELFSDREYSLDTTEVGKEYQYYTKGKEGLYEYGSSGRFAVVITDEFGKRPKGKTNDGFLESVKMNVRAEVKAQVGYHIIHISYPMDNYWLYPQYDHTKSTIIGVHEIIRIDEPSWLIGGSIIVLKKIHAWEYRENRDYGKFSDAIKYVKERIIDRNYCDTNVPKYAFDPKKLYGIRMFVWDGENHVAYDDNGKKIVIHRRHSQYLRDRIVGIPGDRPKAGLLMRYHFTQEKLKQPYMVVDGTELFDGFNTELREKFSDKLVDCRTKSGFVFSAVQEGEDLFAIYDRWDGLQTLKLNKYETALVEKISKFDTLKV